MGLKTFQLERDGKIEGETYANPLQPCREWSKDEEHCKVAQLFPDSSVRTYLSADECREIVLQTREYQN
ncbi:MAG: hypothetical protein M3Y72_09925 [Acidobacteriota bacterium]|nr:hypothetical protein [Acidobacteriota bacterium]